MAVPDRADEARPDDARPDDARTEAARRKRRARVFGDVLPESTSDDRDPSDDRGDDRGDAGSDEWLRRQVPPHHG